MTDSMPLISFEAYKHFFLLPLTFILRYDSIHTLDNIGSFLYYVALILILLFVALIAYALSALHDWYALIWCHTRLGLRT